MDGAGLLGAGHVALGLVLTLDILLHKERPVSAVLWLGIVWALPLVGALAYASFGIDRVRRGARERHAARQLLDRHAEMHPTFERLAVGDQHVAQDDPAAHILRATDPAVRPFRVLRGNRAELLVDGDEFYPALFRDIERAESSIHLQTFIFGRRRIGSALRDLLTARARDGLSVRILYDRFGSTFTHFSGFFRSARRAGVHVSSITQANPLKGRFQINLRNHRKLVVIDGRVGYVGGMNVDEKNVSEFTERQPDRDYHVRLEGPVVADLQFQFIADWHFASNELPDRLLGSDSFPPLSEVGEGLAQIVPGAPEPGGRGLADAFFAAIVAARRSIFIVTPYFVPDEPILQALRYSAQRGLDVRLVLPAMSNHRYTTYAARTLYRPLLERGVRIFERRPPFIHGKAIVVDGVYAMLGSANLDYRSLYLNFELNVEVAESRFVRRVVRQIEAEIAKSEEITLDRHLARAFPIRLVERVCYLFQPVL